MRLDKLQEKLKRKYSSRPKRKVTKPNRLEKQAMKIIGITGSRGKSTTAYLLHQYLKSEGFRVVLYSSIMIDSPVSYNKRDEAVENPLRDEEMILNAIEEAIEYDADYLIMEVNERSIDLGLTKDIPFDIRVLTNIIPQNDIFYPNYVALKQSFLTSASPSVTLITPAISSITVELNHQLRTRQKEDTKYQNQIIKSFSSAYIADRYTLTQSDVDIMLTFRTGYTFDSIEGLNFSIIDDEKTNDFSTNLLMPFHALNITCCITILKALNLYKPRSFSRFIKNIEVPGREEVINRRGKKIIISVNMMPHLETLKKYQTKGEIGRIILVCGATGFGFETWTSDFSNEKCEQEHDLSIKMAYNYIKTNADKVYITTSDSGATNHETLLNMQANLLKDSVSYIKEPNRKKAIKAAINEATDNDVIFIAGRGNRRIMCVGQNQIELHLDKEVTEEIIEEEVV